MPGQLISSHRARILRRNGREDWTGQPSRQFRLHLESEPCRVVASGGEAFTIYVDAGVDVETEDVVASVMDRHGYPLGIENLIIKKVTRARGYDGLPRHLELSAEAAHLDVLSTVDDKPLADI